MKVAEGIFEHSLYTFRYDKVCSCAIPFNFVSSR